MVFVLDKQGKPLMPCTEKRARLLLDRGRARIHRLVPMVIRLIDRHRDGVAQGIGFQHCRLLQRSDGYGHQFTTGATAEAGRNASAENTDGARPPLYLHGLKAVFSREDVA
jgi:hypothetical protein